MSQSPEVPSATSGSRTSVEPATVERVTRRKEKTRDGGWGWVVVLGSCICHFFLIGINRSMGIVYLLLQDQFDATGQQTALAASIFVSFRALGGPVASKLSDRFGCRAVTVTGGVLLCLGLLLTAFAFNITNVYITLGIVAGTGSVLIFSPSYIAVSYWFDKKKGKAMSLSTLGTGFGSIVMGPVIMILVSYYGYFGTMLITSALMLNNSVGGALYRLPPVDSTISQGISMAGSKQDKENVDLKQGPVAVEVDECVNSGEKLAQNFMELKVMPVEKAIGERPVERITGNAQELSARTEETIAEKAENSAANPAEKTVEWQKKSADNTDEKSSKVGASLEPATPGAVPEKSAESCVNFVEKTNEKFSELVGQNANHVPLEDFEKGNKSQASEVPDASTRTAEMLPVFDDGFSEDSNGKAKLENPLPSNEGIDGPFTSVNTNNAVDTKAHLPNSQTSFIPGLQACQSTLDEAGTAKNADVPPRPRHRFVRCPSPLRLLSVFKSSLWFNVPFILYCAMVIATQGCIQAVLIFLPGCGRELGATRQQASLLLTVFGAADMVGRFVFGVVFDLRPLRSRRTHLYTVVAASFAAMTVLLGFMPSYASLAVVTSLVAFFEGGAHSQRATNVLELVEPSQMSIGVGLIIFSQGLGNFYGALAGGALKDRTGSFSSSFIFGGSTLLCACLLTALFHVVRTQIANRRKRKTEDTKAEIA